MLFVVSSNVDKVDPATRKLIRSYVMRGKKQKRGRSDEANRTINLNTILGYTQSGPVTPEEIIELYSPVIPGRVGSDLSFVKLADEIEPSMVLKMTKS